MSAQELLNNFYNLDNLVRVEIDIPQEKWEALRNAKPKGEWGYKLPRYDWHTTNSVTISSRDKPKTTFRNVGMIKKSFAGSISSVKPSFRLDFTRFQESNEKDILGLIGTKTMVLNNSIQDPLFIRQPFGYRLLRQAGVPSLRCNLAKVTINGNDMGVFVNVESFKKPFLENAFNGNKKGNAYEIELQQDIVPSTWSGKWHGSPNFEGYSDFSDERDIKLAAQKCESRDWAAVQKVFDIDAFIKFVAMESLLKHWDGFTQTINNTFMYNDTSPVAKPTVDDVKFKFIPSGIDMILQEDKKFVIGTKPVIAQLIYNDSATKAKLYQQIRDLAKGEVFSDSFCSKQLTRLDAILREAEADGKGGNGILFKQIQQVREEALRVVG